MEIKRNGTRPSEYHRHSPHRSDHSGPEPSRVTVECVTFEPGICTRWDKPDISGLGWTQCCDGPIEEIRPGDVLWCPPGP
jgi:quercetin dioxygenase-like cupin family protein